MQLHLVLHGRDEVRGARRPYRQDPLRRREAVPLRTLCRLDHADHPEGQFQDCMGAKAQECTEQNFGPIGTGRSRSRSSAPTT